MALTIACVLRSGGDYSPEHVLALRRGLQRHWPPTVPPMRMICLTDIWLELYGVERVPLVSAWPGWWAKMELCRRDIRGTLLYFDLDCVIVGGLADLLAVEGLAALRDFYRPGGLQSALMVMPEAERWSVWDSWLESPAQQIRSYRSDQEYLETHWLDRAKRIQDVIPGQVVSYKGDKVAEGGVPKNARVVMYHGKPRPWETDLWTT